MLCTCFEFKVQDASQSPAAVTHRERERLKWEASQPWEGREGGKLKLNGVQVVGKVSQPACLPAPWHVGVGVGKCFSGTCVAPPFPLLLLPVYPPPRRQMFQRPATLPPPPETEGRQEAVVSQPGNVAQPSGEGRQPLPPAITTTTTMCAAGRSLHTMPVRPPSISPHQGNVMSTAQCLKPKTYRESQLGEVPAAHGQKCLQPPGGRVPRGVCLVISKCACKV